MGSCERMRHRLKGCVEGQSTLASLWATPTAAPTAGQPTALSAPLALPSLAFQAPYAPAHISDTTNTSHHSIIFVAVLLLN